MGSIKFHRLQPNWSYVRKGNLSSILFTIDIKIYRRYVIDIYFKSIPIQYSAEELGGFGGGGEYNVQTGFGWSNGVIMQFLSEHGRHLKSSGSEKPSMCHKENAIP